MNEPVDKPLDGSPDLPAPNSPAAVSAQLMRSSLKAALATLDGGHPYASLVLVATEPDGAPVLLISRLARHTRNLEANPQASLLFDGTGDGADPLSGPRVTVRGTARRTDDPAALRRFLARHPSAEGYARFPDFATWRLEVSDGHFIGGFGRIVDLPASALLLPPHAARALVEAEPEMVAHMNADHADAVALYATRLCGQPEGSWRMTGIDPGGIDLALGARTARLPFPGLTLTPGAVRKALVDMAAQARRTP